MNTHMHGHPHRPGASPEQFIALVQRLTPDADPASVVLFGEIMRTNHKLLHATGRHMADAGLSWGKLRLLMALGGCEREQGAGLQPSELSDLQGISRNTVSALIAGLEEDGLVSREPQGQDRRKFVIRLTLEGREVLDARLAEHFRFVTECMGLLEPTERESLLVLLRRFNQRLTETSEQP